MLVAEEEKRKLEREQTLNERVPALRLSGLSVQDLQVRHGECVTEVRVKPAAAQTEAEMQSN